MSQSIEDRVGVERLAALHARRDRIIAELAPLQAKYGDYRIAEAERKVVLAKCELEARLAAEGKMTDRQADAEAHAHPEYEAWVTRAIAERTRMVVLENEAANVTESINRDQRLIAYVTEELRLGGGRGA